MIVALYLAAIVTANLITATYGPAASIVVAFVFVAFDLVARDVLHDRWRGKQLRLRMLLLIVTGGALSAVVNVNALQIAVASTVAFIAASVVDALVYQALLRRRWLQRANASNVAAAVVDSLVFPTLAFGGLMVEIVVAQFLAKTLGGLLWSIVLNRIATPRLTARRAVP